MPNLAKTFLPLVPLHVEKKLARAQDFSRPKIDVPPFTHTPISHNTAHKLAGDIRGALKEVKDNSAPQILFFSAGFEQNC